MFFAKYPALQVHSLDHELFGFGVFALVAVQHRNINHAQQRKGMFLTQYSAVRFQYFVLKHLGLRELPFRPVHYAEVIHGL